MIRLNTLKISVFGLRWWLLWCVIAAALPVPALAKNDDDDFVDPAIIAAIEEEAANWRPRATRGYSWTEVDGDTVPMIWLSEVVVFPEMKFRNKKEEEYYWRTVRDVKKALPYAKLICETMLETYEYIETFPTQKEREDYLKEMEKEIFKQYKPILKKFTRSQAKVLVKLINRETNQSSYNIIKAFLGSFRASFWQTFGRFFGVNLKADYRPDKDRQDAILERIAVAVETGRL